MGERFPRYGSLHHFSGATQDAFRAEASAPCSAYAFSLPSSPSYASLRGLCYPSGLLSRLTLMSPRGFAGGDSPG